MRVLALTKHPYNGHTRSPGEEYEMLEEFVPVMTALGHVTTMTREVLVRRDLEATGAKKYKRRDLKAE